MKKVFYIAIILITGAFPTFSQYAPAAEEPGSTAVHKDSPLFVAWGSRCTVNRGYIKISDTTLVYNGSNRANHGNTGNALGKADGKIVSLGDGGTAIFTLDTAITDNDGFDFVVFENGFKSQEPPQNYFLELAFVEVSSDGSHFVRFPAVSETPAATQVSTFGQIDPAQIHNLAGKYTVNYGTPFDLYELSDSSGIDIENITHVRIIDVVGNINDTYASFDVNGNKVNDPWPTPFASGGFDLDALGIINQRDVQTDVIGNATLTALKIFPNPVQSGHPITLKPFDFDVAGESLNIAMVDVSGKLVFKKMMVMRQNTGGEIHLPVDLSPGMYAVQLSIKGKRLHTKLFVSE